MAGISEDQVSRLTDAVVRAANPQRVILFGSQARASAKDSSDIDLMIVGPLDRAGSRRREIARIRRSLPPLGLPIDILFFTPDEVEQWRETTNHVIAEALREGRCCMSGRECTQLLL